MQPNKKYVAQDGHEYFMCPMTQFTITQVENVGTHKGTKAVDFASGTPGYRAPYYAPATVKCVQTIPSHGEATWQTVNKVHCPNGYFGVVTFETVHDNSFNASVGMVIKQGQQLGNMGDKGQATGVHLHIEFTQSSDSRKGYNGHGVYSFVAQESYVDDTFYVDDTKIINGGQGNWRKIPKNNATTGYDPSKLIPEKGRCIFKNDVPIIVHRDSPTGPKYGSYVKGEVLDYTEKYIGNGHRYVSYIFKGIRCFVAVSPTEERSTEWCDFVEYGGEQKPQPQPQPQPKPEPPKKEFPDSVKFKGIDISEHNKDIDVKGNDFVIIRATYGTYTDKYFLQNVQKCNDLKIPFGVYCYDYALNDEQALEQPTYLLKLLQDNKIVPQLGVWFDMEDADAYKKKNGVLNKERCTSSCKIFCDYFKEHGYYTGIYSSTSWFGNLIDETGYPKWIANWGTNDGTCQNDFSNMAVMHQYTSIPLDKNVMYVDMGTMTSSPKEEIVTPKPEQPSFPDIDTDQLNDFFSVWTEIGKRLLG